MNAKQIEDYFKEFGEPIKKIIDEKLLDSKVLFLENNILGWGKFAKSIIEFNKEISESKNLRVTILLTTLMIEMIIDMIIINFYALNKHLKYDSYRFLSNITLRNKIEIIKELKRRYPSKRPQENYYEEPIKIKFSNIEVWHKFKEKFGEDFLDKIIKINDEIDKEKGIKKPKWASSLNATLSKDDDFLNDDIFTLIHKINTSKMHKLDDYRNKIAHYLDPKDLLISLKKTDKDLRKFCEDILYEIAGIIPREK